MALSFQAFSTYIVFFYVDIVKLPAYLAATGMLIYAVWNAINDPLAGYISDHTHSRWGRRIPYIALGAIPFGLIYFLLWIPPFTEYSQIFMLFIYFVVFICLFDTFYTITILNWSCLYPEMFPGLKERSQVNAFRQTFTMFGLLLGVALPPIIYGSLGWGVLGAVFGVLIAVSLLIVLFGSREHVQYCQEKQLSFWLSFKYTFQNSSFLTFVFANFFVQFSFLMVLATVPFFTKYVYTHGQEVSVKAVADNKIDGASVSSYVWEYINKKDPGLASRTRVIWKSESYASPPFVVRPGLFPELKNKLESILLGADIDPEGSRILRCLIIEKFVPARDEAFDKIRAIKAGLINSGGE